MNIINIIVFAVFGSLVCIVLKDAIPELFSVSVFCVGTVILIMIINYVGEIFDFFQKFYEYSGISAKDIIVVIKIVAISYLVEFGVGMVEDLGLKSLSDKIVLAGKIVIFTISIPIIENIFYVIVQYLR